MPNEERARKLTEQIMVNPNFSKAGILANDLLTEFHQGYALDNLLPLLHSQNEELVGIGIWIASELGEKGKPLLRDVFPLLRHSSKRVRFLAIDCLLVWADPSHKYELTSVVALLEDAQSVVRRKTMDFLSRASREQIQAALSYLEAAASE